MIYRKISVFKNGYHLSDLFTIKHVYVFIKKIKSRKNKKIHDILRRSPWVCRVPLRAGLVVGSRSALGVCGVQGLRFSPG